MIEQQGFCVASSLCLVSPPGRFVYTKAILGRRASHKATHQSSPCELSTVAATPATPFSLV